VGHGNHAGDMSLARRGTEDRIGLRAGIAELLQILDRVEARLAIGNVDVEIVLLALLVDRDAFEDQIVLVVRRDRRRLEHGILDAVFGDAVLDDVDLEVQPARHLDGAAEGDLAVALAEMQVPMLDRALQSLDRQVTNVTVLAEHSRRHQAPALSRLKVDRQRRYGDTMVTVYRP